MSVNVGHGVAIIGVKDGLLKLLLDKSEEKVDQGGFASYKVALAFKMIVGRLQRFLEEPVHILMLN